MDYLITFVCYGTQDPDGEAGWVEPAGLPETFTFQLAGFTTGPPAGRAPYRMDPPRRTVVLRAMQDVCRQRKWELRAARVSSSRVRAVVDADVPPDWVISALKNQAGCELHALDQDPLAIVWASSDTARWLWLPEHVVFGICFVTGEQGDAFSVSDRAEAQQ